LGVARDPLLTVAMLRRTPMHRKHKMQRCGCHLQARDREEGASSHLQASRTCAIRTRFTRRRTYERAGRVCSELAECCHAEVPASMAGLEVNDSVCAAAEIVPAAASKAWATEELGSLSSARLHRHGPFCPGALWCSCAPIAKCAFMQAGLA
jgi:hypothetical protein